MNKKKVCGVLYVLFLLSGLGLSLNHASASPPAISNVRVANIIGPGAQIMWDTDQPSNSRVVFGSAPSTYTLFSDWSCNSTAGGGTAESVTHHCINLTNLSYSTLYYYKVESMNATSEDAQAGGYSFTSGSSSSSGSGSSGTPPPPPPSTSTTPPSSSTSSTSTTAPNAPWSLSLQLASNGKDVVLNWADNSSNEDGFQIFWRPLGGAWAYLAFVGSNITAFTYYNHPAGSYEYHINACNSYGCSPDSNTASITVASSTATAPTSGSGTDTTPPVFSNVHAENKILSGAQIKWSTDDLSDSKVLWGTSSGVYPSSSDSRCDLGGYITDHCVNLTGLTAGVIYYFKAVSKNSSALEGASLETTFLAGSDSYTATTTTTATQPPTATLQTNATVSGKILDPQGQAVAGAGIYIHTADLSLSFGGSTDSSGNFKVSVAAGNYTLEIYPPFQRSELLKPPSVDLSVASGETKNLSLQFSTPLKIITGAVTFSNGQPVSDADVGAYSKDTGQWTHVLVDSLGKYSLKVSGGGWQVSIMPKSGSGSWSYAGNYQEISFLNDATAEIKTLNFSVEPANNVLTVSSQDMNGNPVTGAGIIVDTKSAAGDLLNASSSPQFGKPDSSGKVQFSLKSGTYYVRGSLSSDLGYLNPQEQSITLTGGTYSVALFFIKQTIAQTLNIKGQVRFEAGIGAEAFVWGWSENGGMAETRSNSLGEFNLVVAKPQQQSRWHIGAGKELDRVPYKSSELTFDVGTNDVSGAELLLVKLDTALPQSVTASNTALSPIVAAASDGAKMTLPANSVASSGNVVVEMTPTVEAPSQASAQIVSTVYDITVKDASGDLVKQLKGDMEIILPYDEKILQREGVGEDNLIPSYFDETAGVWVKINNFTIDKTKNIVIARVNHLTRFALVAAADITPPAAPTNLKIAAIGKGNLKLTWTNPLKDFDHAKIYRSEKKDDLGKAIFAEVNGETKVDNELKTGETYYYVVRAVDPAGNESENTDQAAALASAASSSLPPGQAFKLAILRNLTQGSKGEDIKTLQGLLLREGLYPEGLITGFFGKLTKQAVIRFQEKYADKILKPAGLGKGTGFVGPATLKKINQLLLE